MKADLALRQRIEARTEQPRRDVIGFILLYRIDLTDRHPVKTAVIGAALVYGMCCVLHAWGLL